VRLPGRADAARRIVRIAAHLAVMPSICELADAPLPDDRKVDGRSLLPLLQGRRIAWPDRQLVLQTHRGDVPRQGHHFALVGQRWKLLRHSGFGKRELPDQVPLQLFDLQADPGEGRDVAAAHPDVVARLLADYRAWFADVSATRPDNYAKPRIVVGDASEPVTVLTRQDWVPADGVGWGHDGRWLLRLERARKVDVTVVFREQRVVERTSIQAGGKPFVERMVVESDRITYENVPFAVGDVDLQITCTDGTTTVAPYQVILTPR
jgi:hypothetical protein